MTEDQPPATAPSEALLPGDSTSSVTRRRRSLSLHGVAEQTTNIVHRARRSLTVQGEKLARQVDANWNSHEPTYTKRASAFKNDQMNKGLHLMRDGIKKAGARVPRGAPCRELTIYITFFICYVILVTQECDYIKKTFEIQEGLKEMFVDDHPENFENVQTVMQLGRTNYFLNDFWSWWEENVEGALYPCCAEDPESYCCDVKPNLTQLTDGVYQVGAVRIRTKKVQPNSCNVNSRMADTLDELGVKCYTDYVDSKQETLPYGEDDRWVWSDDDTAGYSSYGRTVDFSYGGYIVDLPRSWHGDEGCEVKDSYGVALEEDAKCNAGGGKVLAAMKEDFLDISTRMVVISINLLNPAHNLYGIYMLGFEFSSSGYTWKLVRFHMWPKRNYIEQGRILIVILLIVTNTFVLYFIMDLVSQVYRKVTRIQGNQMAQNPLTSLVRSWQIAIPKGLAMYFFNFWNALELVNVSLLVLASIYRVQMAYNGWTTNEDELKNLVGYEYTNNEFLADINYQEISCTALNVLFSFLKVFKYLRVSPRMYLPWKTLERASTDLICFMLVFVGVMFSFIIVAHLVFGKERYEYRRIETTVKTCTMLLLGEFNYDDLPYINSVIAPIFFYGYVILVVMVLLNMSIAIVTDQYSQQHRELGYLKMKITALVKEQVEQRLGKIGSTTNKWHSYFGKNMLSFSHNNGSASARHDKPEPIEEGRELDTFSESGASKAGAPGTGEPTGKGVQNIQVGKWDSNIRAAQDLSKGTDEKGPTPPPPAEPAVGGGNVHNSLHRSPEPPPISELAPSVSFLGISTRKTRESYSAANPQVLARPATRHIDPQEENNIFLDAFASPVPASDEAGAEEPAKEIPAEAAKEAAAAAEGSSAGSAPSEPMDPPASVQDSRVPDPPKPISGPSVGDPKDDAAEGRKEKNRRSMFVGSKGVRAGASPESITSTTPTVGMDLRKFIEDRDS